MRFNLISVSAYDRLIIYGRPLHKLERTTTGYRFGRRRGARTRFEDDLVQAYLSQVHITRRTRIVLQRDLECLFEQPINNRIMVQEAAKEPIRIKGKRNES